MASLKEVFQNQPVDIDQLPQFEQVELERLSSKYLVKKYALTGIWLIIFLLITVTANYFFGLLGRFLVVVLLLEILMFGWFFYCNYRWMKTVGYAVRDRDVIFRRGFLMEKNTVVPFNRIQHVSTDRGILDKFLDLATLNIFTAGGSGSDISIPGLSPQTAEKLKNAFSERITSNV